MSDALYLSLWYPNLRLAALAEKLTAVLSEFSRHGGESRVYAATVWPVNWHEAPVFQRVWGRALAPESPAGAEPRAAVAEALELLHEDYAYEFQIGWSLWEMENGPGGAEAAGAAERQMQILRSAQDDRQEQNRILRSAQDDNFLSKGNDAERREAESGARWARGLRLVRVTGFGPLFDEGAFEQDGHIRIDYGSDAPFLEEEAALDSAAAGHMAENVRQLVDLTLALEQASGATARLLWSELGESLAQRLAQRLAALPGRQGN